MEHVRSGPDQEGCRIAEAGADAINDITEDDVADGISQLEVEDDVRVGRFMPAEIVLERRLQKADHLSIDIVDCRRGEEQRDDDPTYPADFHRSRRRGFLNWAAGHSETCPLPSVSGVPRHFYGKPVSWTIGLRTYSALAAISWHRTFSSSPNLASTDW